MGTKNKKLMPRPQNVVRVGGIYKYIPLMFPDERLQEGSIVRVVSKPVGNRETHEYSVEVKKYHPYNDVDDDIFVVLMQDLVLIIGK